MRRVSNSRDPNRAWNGSNPPTETAPIVSGRGPEVDPQRRVAVEQSPAVGRVQPAALARLDHEVRLGDPRLLLRERVPHVLVVAGDQVLRALVHGASLTRIRLGLVPGAPTTARAATCVGTGRGAPPLEFG